MKTGPRYIGGELLSESGDPIQNSAHHEGCCWRGGGVGKEMLGKRQRGRGATTKLFSVNCKCITMVMASLPGLFPRIDKGLEASAWNAWLAGWQALGAMGKC